MSRDVTAAERQSEKNKDAMASGLSPWEKKPTQFKPVGKEDRHYRHWIKKPMAPDATYEEQAKGVGDMILTARGVERVNDMGRV